MAALLPRTGPRPIPDIMRELKESTGVDASKITDAATAVCEELGVDTSGTLKEKVHRAAAALDIPIRYEDMAVDPTDPHAVHASNSNGAAAAAEEEEEEIFQQSPEQVLGALDEIFDVVDVISNKQYTLLYKVVDKSYGRTPYVLKCFFKDDIPGKHDAKEFEREKGMLETINQRNPKVAVKLFDAKSHDETGSDFNVLVLEQGRMTAVEYVAKFFLPLPVSQRHVQQRLFVKMLVEKLADLHDAGVVHCDVKLENVIVLYADELYSNYQLKLIDFGSAADLQTNPHQSWPAFEGKPIFSWTSASFEAVKLANGVLKSHSVSPSDDIFCLAIMIAGVCGDPPGKLFPTNEDGEECYAAAIKLGSTQPFIDRATCGGRRDIQAIVRKGLSFDPKDRGTAREVLEAAFATHTSMHEKLKQRSEDASVLGKLDAMNSKLERVEEKVDATLAAVQKSLTVVLSLVNEDCSYPRTFLVLPKVERTGGSASSRMRRLFETCDTFQVVFLCETTLAPIK